MRAEPLFVLALALFASAAPAPEAEANAVAAADAEAHAHAVAEADDSGLVSKRDGSVLEKRACKYNGCKCTPGTNPGVYCWGCSQVINWGNVGAFSSSPTGWVFQCARSGNCCAYGPRDSCAGGKANPCGS